ncbi:MAG TPA: hypothetical protein IGS31_19730 [Oscillatoriales cyanobacterium M4454_W2019_049]|nr:hypothetical protein [Oscillatoriales cyanobacterium M4454_W2019_049]
MQNRSFLQLTGEFEELLTDRRIFAAVGLAFSASRRTFFTIAPSFSNPGTQEILSIPSLEDRSSIAVEFSLNLGNPTHLTFDPIGNRLLVVDRATNLTLEVRPQPNGSFGTPRPITATPQLFGVQNLQGIAVDPVAGDLYFLDATRRQILRLQPNGVLGFSRPIVSPIPLPPELGTPQSLAFDPQTGNLQVLDSSELQLYELGKTGEVITIRDLSDLDLSDPQSIVFAPSADATDDPTNLSLYVIDGNPTRGGIVELSLNELPVFGGTDNSPLVRTIDLAAFNPPSPDPAGIAFNNFRNSLLVSDGEVEEIPTLFTGDNLFEATLSGTLTQTGTTIPYSDEPTGLDINPANRHLFVSDDDANRIFEIDPGADFLYGNADDRVVNPLNTQAFGSGDAEGVAFASDRNTLFISDGVNNQIYQVTPTGTIVSQFDTASLGVSDPEGIAYNPDLGTLYIVGKPATSIAEVTVDGTLVRTINISAANPRKPAGLAYGPSSRDPNGKSLYISDRGVDNNTDPNENDGKVYEFLVESSRPIVNAGIDRPIVGSTILDGSISDDGLPNPPGTVTASWTQISGPGTANFANPNAEDTAVSFSTPGTYVLRLSGNDGENTVSDDVAIEVLNPASTLFISSSASGTVGEIDFKDEDILAFDTLTGNWLMYFDGSDVGLTANADVDAFHINPDGSILLSVSEDNVEIPGIGAIDDSDIVRFVPTSTGWDTAGTYQMYLDGSTVGLDVPEEDIDAITFGSDGLLVVSLRGSSNILGVFTSRDEDLLAFNGSAWSLHFDGSDVGLNVAGLDVNAASIDLITGAIDLGFNNPFSISGFSGDSDDIARFTPNSLGTNTSGNLSLAWDGSAVGFAKVDGFSRIL